MDEEQAAIVRVIRSKGFPYGDISYAITVLCFIVGFPEHFDKSYAQMAFEQACFASSYPSTEDLKLLMEYPNLLVAMMKYREGKLNPAGAVWNPKPPPPVASLFRGAPINKVLTPMDGWLYGEFNSLGLNK